MVFAPQLLPPRARDAFHNPLLPWEVCASYAFEDGVTDHNVLADIVFYHSHRELMGKALSPAMPNYRELADEWLIWLQVVKSSFNSQYGAPSGAPRKKVVQTDGQKKKQELNRNLGNAKKAVAYARSVLPNGAANNWDDVKRSRGLALSSTLCARVAMLGVNPGVSWDVNELRLLSSVAKSCGGGNCGEHAAVAFIYLVDRYVSPVDIMERANADHNFVVIGRYGRAHEPGTWGETAVVCDPWMNKAYPATEINKQMAAGARVSPVSTYRHRGNYCPATRKD